MSFNRNEFIKNIDYIYIALLLRNHRVPKDEIKSLEKDRKYLQPKIEALKSEKNKLSKVVGSLKKQGLPIQEILNLIKNCDNTIKVIESDVKNCVNKIQDIIDSTPNIPHETVPLGGVKDEYLIEYLQLGHKMEMDDFKIEVRKFIDSQKPLGYDFEKVLNDNLRELWEC